MYHPAKISLMLPHSVGPVEQSSKDITLPLSVGAIELPSKNIIATLCWSWWTTQQKYHYCHSLGTTQQKYHYCHSLLELLSHPAEISLLPLCRNHPAKISLLPLSAGVVEPPRKNITIFTVCRSCWTIQHFWRKWTGASLWVKTWKAWWQSNMNQKILLVSTHHRHHTGRISDALCRFYDS